MGHAARRRPRARIGRSLRAAAASVAALLAVRPPAAAEPPPAGAAPAPFVLCSDVTNVRIYEFHKRVYTEAFRRLGLPVAFAAYSLTRRAALAEEGTIDGELARVGAYGEAHPRLVRVEEPVYDFSFALYSARPDVHLARLDDLAGSAWVVEYRRGILLCQKELERRVPRERLSDVSTPEQGIRKLIDGRTDLYCELDEFMEEAVRRPEFRAHPVHRVLRFATLPTYAYLGEKHAALARRLAEVLRQMKAEGLLERWLRESREDGGGG